MFMRLKRKYCGIELTNNLIELNSIGQLSEIDGRILFHAESSLLVTVITILERRKKSS
jgi:hypothetical protein